MFSPNAPIETADYDGSIQHLWLHKLQLNMITATEKIWKNGKLINWNDAQIHVLAHVTSYGSSVFEGVRCYATPAGPMVFRINEHARRLRDSAKIYRMEIPFSTAELTADTA